MHKEGVCQTDNCAQDHDPEHYIEPDARFNPTLARSCFNAYHLLNAGNLLGHLLLPPESLLNFQCTLIEKHCSIGSPLYNHFGYRGKLCRGRRQLTWIQSEPLICEIQFHVVFTFWEKFDEYVCPGSASFVSLVPLYCKPPDIRAASSTEDLPMELELISRSARVHGPEGNDSG